MNERFEALDAFRGLAALSVVVFHMHLVGSITEIDFFRGSSLFVEFFFVLSGFVLAHGYGSKVNLNFSTFMRARFFRLYPLHFFMLLFFLLLEIGKLAAYKYGDFTFNSIPFTGRTAISEIIPNLLLVQSWTPMSDSLSFNYPSWSISIEFYLYFFLFISIVIFNKFKSIIWCSAAIAALYLIASGSDIIVQPVMRGLSCFFGGAFMYLLYNRISHIKLKKPLGSTIEISIIICIVVVQSKFKYQSIAATFLFYFAVLVFSFEFGIVSSLLKLKPFQQLGKFSYSIYMTHAAILFCLTSILMLLQNVTGIVWAPMLDKIRFLNFGSAFVNNFMIISILCLVILISSLTYKHIELKWQRKSKIKNVNLVKELPKNAVQSRRP